MTEAMKTTLKERIDEELADCKTYAELSAKAIQEGEHRAAGVLKDMSDEEMIHAHMLEHILRLED